MRLAFSLYLFLVALAELAHVGYCVTEWSKAEALTFCENFEDLYEGIANDLRHWPHGIDRYTQ
jgi:archaellum biogenesis protein FlaJ (TadC family)